MRTGNDLSLLGIVFSGEIAFIYESAKDPLGQYQLHHCLPLILAKLMPAIIQRGIKYPIRGMNQPAARSRRKIVPMTICLARRSFFAFLIFSFKFMAISFWQLSHNEKDGTTGIYYGIYRCMVKMGVRNNIILCQQYFYRP